MCPGRRTRAGKEMGSGMEIAYKALTETCTLLLDVNGELLVVDGAVSQSDGLWSLELPTSPGNLTRMNWTKRSLKPGDRVSIGIYRGTASLHVEVTLGARPGGG